MSMFVQEPEEIETDFEVRVSCPLSQKTHGLVWQARCPAGKAPAVRFEPLDCSDGRDHRAQ